MPHLVAIVATVLAHLLDEDWAANSPLGVAEVVVIVHPPVLSILLADMALVLLDLTLDGLAVDTVGHGAGTGAGAGTGTRTR
uniref:Uncharacterized protein n=1 Tax=viral metagenome TaxID=1070528 RepID=A0A6C0LBC8_9ZZZZ